MADISQITLPNGVTYNLKDLVARTTLAPLASPAFTGTPTAPTAAVGTNTTQIATTAFVKTAVSAIDGQVEIGSTQPISESIKIWIEI